jgi:RHS repeat-associated protein
MNSFNVYITSFGAPYADATASKGADVQPYKCNGKELDLMHGLNTYDYGARQHDPILARWDRIDPLCEKYYEVSPYNYCLNNPVMLVDPDGRVVGNPFIEIIKYTGNAIKKVAGACGRAVVAGFADAGGQVTCEMTSKDESFGEAVGNIDLTSVGNSMTTAFMGSKSKGSIISGVADYADASIDVSANEGVKIVGGGKGVGEALVDLKMPNSSGLAEKTRTSFSDALTTDLSSGYGRAMTKQTRTQLKKVKEVVGSNSAKTFTLSVDTYANSTTGGYVGQSFDNLVNFLISSFLYRGQTNSIYGTKGDVLPVDNLRVQK